jgi:hypothetical protein
MTGLYYSMVTQESTLFRQTISPSEYELFLFLVISNSRESEQLYGI